jgi:hypothetical protein
MLHRAHDRVYFRLRSSLRMQGREKCYCWGQSLKPAALPFASTGGPMCSYRDFQGIGARFRADVFGLGTTNWGGWLSGIPFPRRKYEVRVRIRRGRMRVGQVGLHVFCRAATHLGFRSDITPNSAGRSFCRPCCIRLPPHTVV